MTDDEFLNRIKNLSNDIFEIEMDIEKHKKEMKELESDKLKAVESMKTTCEIKFGIVKIPPQC